MLSVELQICKFSNVVVLRFCMAMKSIRAIKVMKAFKAMKAMKGIKRMKAKTILILASQLCGQIRFTKLHVSLFYKHLAIYLFRVSRLLFCTRAPRPRRDD